MKNSQLHRLKLQGHVFVSTLHSLDFYSGTTDRMWI